MGQRSPAHGTGLSLMFAQAAYCEGPPATHSKPTRVIVDGEIGRIEEGN